MTDRTIEARPRGERDEDTGTAGPPAVAVTAHAEVAARADLVRRARIDGVGGLSDAELLELIGGCGAPVELTGDGYWSRFGADEWSSRRGTAADGGVGGARLAAAFELGRRAERVRRRDDAALDGPERAAAWLVPQLRGERQECFVALVLDGRHRVRRVETVARGTLTASLVHPREVFAPALRESAAAVLVAHNHPSGDVRPSAEDYAVTRRLGRAARILGIALLDHLVVSGSAFHSLRRHWSEWPRHVDTPPLGSARPRASSGLSTARHGL